VKLLHVALQPKQCSESQECKQMHAHAHRHTLPRTRVHTRTHVRSVSVGDQLCCRSHSAAAAAARAPRLRSRSFSAAVSDIPARQLWGGHLCHPGPFAEFFTRGLLGCFQLALGGRWATG